MAHKIIWSPQALADLEQIGDYIARDSVFYANRVAQRILQAVDSASLFPNMGRVVPERDDPSLRELIVYSYRVVYRLRSEAIEVVAVIHGARGPEALGGIHS